MYNFHLIIYIKLIKELQFFTNKYLSSLFHSASVMTVGLKWQSLSELQETTVGMPLSGLVD